MRTLQLSMVRTAFFLIAASLVSSPAQARYSGGFGTADDPYQIATAADLMTLGETPDDYDKHFLLTVDVDLDPNLPGRKVFDKAVIAPDTDADSVDFEGIPFRGVFNGNDHTISHLMIAGKDCLGLFGKIEPGAMISSLGLEAADVRGTGYYVGSLVGKNGDWEAGARIADCHASGAVSGYAHVGGLVGYSSGCIISCHCTAVVNGSSHHAGGLVGRNNQGIITSCYSTARVCGGSQVGGLVGCNYGRGSITTSYSTGKVSGDVDVGGLVGYSSSHGVYAGLYWADGYLADCYSTGAVSGRVNVGGLAGFCVSGSITRCYSTGAVTGDDDVGGLVGCETDTSVTSSFWDVQTSGQSRSEGGVGKTTAEMQDVDTYLGERWDCADETLNGTCDYWWIERGEYPRLRHRIGDSLVMPEGLGTAEQPYLIRDARDLGTVWLEPLAHYRLEEPVDLSGITWSVAVVPWFGGTFDGNGHVISKLHIQGDRYIGLFGQLESGARVFGLGLEAVEVSGNFPVGALAAYNCGSIFTSYSTGAVGGGDDVGGLVGWNADGNVTASYSTCAVAGDWLVGGLVGYAEDGSITMSYSTGTVAGDGFAGGLVGQRSKSGPDVIDGIANFWDVETSGRTWSEGGTGLTTAEMQTASTFLDAGWDLMDETENGTEDLWWILDGRDYPRLWWEATGGGNPNF